MENLSYINCFSLCLVFLILIQYIEKLPKGKHSTKGLGKKVPKTSDFVKWKDEVIVPCGKPVSANARAWASELMYNEYIVYNPAQVSSKILAAFVALDISPTLSA